MIRFHDWGEKGIKVIGVGGAGNNIVDTMVERGVRGVELIQMDTDSQVLKNSTAFQKVQIGSAITRGEGCGGDVELARKAFQGDRNEIINLLRGASCVFLCAGLGGGTGTGILPLLGEMCKQSDALTIAVVTKPFPFEGERKVALAKETIGELENKTHAVITLSNQRLLGLSRKGIPLNYALREANTLLSHTVTGISDLLTTRGLINLNLSHIRAVLREGRKCLVGIAEAQGENKVLKALNKASHSPLVESFDVRRSEGLLVSITGGKDLTAREAADGLEIFLSGIHKPASVTLGIIIEEKMEDRVRITLIAAGLKESEELPQSDGRSFEGEVIKEVESNIGYDSRWDIPTFMRVKREPEEFTS